ncbi:plant cysteine oxidase [Marchantia polymorpha subsp. ruderalis]|uniref:cysteine dioxygenase n=2 Tax=Marchantia polymorpha TaxID=3197 RepID=A0AAF6B9U7_MARPO|nr:hypothetical protein MARPO_0070s0038 [Marchantia polymorpha]BBN08781.1 hypothetical protein Mp_4g14430 [Marchantia polymorpha subsp. ruderalis]|eukprot:PTQ35571.1 hypothetical protein MARPO_0070s0038 [Marchantia polymorpha]
MMTAVQRLHDVCKATFTMSAPPSAQALQRVRTILDSIQASDVGLDEVDAMSQERGFGFFGTNGRRGRHTPMVARWAPPISYLHLYECEDFSMGIFCLPTSAQIPLHNHPGMTVLSKLLYGSMHVKAYDWVNPCDEKLNSDPSVPRSAKLVVNRVLTAPCETATLHPTSGGNIHAFTAVTPCAVLDVLAPPYSAVTGRHCTYYREAHSVGSNPGGIIANGEHREESQVETMLEEYLPPDDFVVQRGEYRGPRVGP